MIPITKTEKELLVSLFPKERFPRTMKHDSKRGHYFCVEREDMMRAIADTNTQAAERVAEIDRERALKAARRKKGGGAAWHQDTY